MYLFSILLYPPYNRLSHNLPPDGSGLDAPLIYTHLCTPTRVRSHALMTHVTIYKIIYNLIGINPKIPEQMNALGKGNLVHYLWVDVAI